MSDRHRRFHPSMFGVAVGLALADLLVGLNPHLLAPAGLVRPLLFGALSGALVFAPFALLSPSPERPSRAALGGAGALLVVLAVLVERQRQLHYLFLMNGARRVLVATSLALALAAGVLLVGAIRPPRPGALTRLLAAAILLMLAPPLFGRRTPERTPLATPAPTAERSTRGILVVGLEGISWDLLSAWSSDGSLPVFARLLREGAAGPLASVRPYVRSALWTTAATGKRPSKHGVIADDAFATPLGFLRLVPRPEGAPPPSRLPFSRTVPLAGRVRRSRAFWEILAARGHGVAVLAWPGSYPARDGCVLWATEELFSGDASPDAGRPAAAAASARLLSGEPAPLDRFLVRTLLPDGHPEADRARARPLAGAAHDQAVLGAALAALPGGPASVSAFVLDGLAEEARVFSPSAAPARYWGLSPRDADPRARALRAYYRFLDETLGVLLEREGSGRVLCVFSPVGWGAPSTLVQLADVLRGREPEASPDASSEGFLVLSGEGIRSGVRLTDASAVDLAPTLLVLAGEPIARDMDGRVLAEAFDERFARDASVPVITTFEPGGPQ